MARIQYIPNRVIDRNGISDGAELFVYQSGTTTKVPLFSDEGLTQPIVNPIETVVGAEVPVFYTSYTSDIRLRIIDRRGNVAMDEDPYFAPITDAELQPVNDFIDNVGGPTGSQLVGFQQAGTGAVLRDSEEKMRESVSVKDFGAVGGNAVKDTTAILNAIATGKSVFFPDGDYLFTGKAALRTGQSLFANGNVTIVGNSNDWLFETIGYPSAVIANLSSAVVVDPYVWTLTFNTTDQMSAGMRILLHDPVTDQFEINIIDQVVSNSVRCKWPIMQPFPVPARVLVRRMDCIENASIEGIKITNSGTGGLVRFVYTDNCGLVNCTLGPSNYIGAALESSVFPYAEGVRQNNCGASGIGFRNARSFRCDNSEVIVTPRSDEPYTVYFNSGPGRFKNCDAVGELFGAPGAQGNSYLIDTRCAHIDISGCSAEGSRTYHVLVTGSDPSGAYPGCRDINVVGNRLGRANLGHVKVEGQSKRVRVDGNLLSSIVDATDAITAAQLGLPSVATASVRVMPDSSDCYIGTNSFSAIAGLAVDDRQSSPGSSYARKGRVNTQLSYVDLTVAGTFGVITPDFSPLSAGAIVYTGFRSGKAYIVSSGNGDSAAAPLYVDASALFFRAGAAVPTINDNSEMTFRLATNTSLEVYVRGTDGVTRKGTVTLA